MSLSKPSENAPNPATRWFEWNGEKGGIRYYDKDAKANVDVSDFSFILLDQLGSVGGWHDASDSAIFSNMVRDTRQDVLVVKSHKGGVLAEGVYKDIKDGINAKGGQFVALCFVAFKGDDGLQIGALRFKGAALSAWMEFTKANRSALTKGAVAITGFTEGQKGRVIYRVPTMKPKPVSPETLAAAVSLDAELQEWLDAYLRRTKREQAEQPHQPEPQEAQHDDYPPRSAQPITDDDIPF